MDTKQNIASKNDLKARLVTFCLLAVMGLALGLFYGCGTSSDTGSSGIVSRDATAPAADDTDLTDDQDETFQEYTSADDLADEFAADEDADEQDTSDVNAPDDTPSDSGQETAAPTRGPTVEKNGRYTSKDEVALYIHTYGRLPSNFISKTKARDRGWVAQEGNLDEVCPGMSIGGSRYYNDDGELPDKRGRQWTECDINYHGGYRGAERIVFSNDGLIYYTGDHYETFVRLY